MKGTILKRGSRYSVVVELARDRITGQRRREWHSGYTTKRDAEAARVEILARLQRGDYVAPSKRTVGGFLEDEWLPAIRSTLRASTHESYSANVRLHIAPAIGSVRLQGLTPAMLNALYAELASERQVAGRTRQPLSPRTILYIHATIRRALADAVSWDLITRNPADRATPPSARVARGQQMRTWTAAQLRIFLEHVVEDRLYAAWRVSGTTGMRRGEVLGLRWRDVDLDAARCSVFQTLITGKGAPRVSEPKTASGRRNVALDPQTVVALRTHRGRQAAEQIALGPAYEDSELVFCHEDGSPIWPRSFSRWFDLHVEKAKLPKIRLHDLRHTHATLALAAGIHPKVVSERLGHSTVGITLDTYSHAIPAMQEDAAVRVAALIEG